MKVTVQTMAPGWRRVAPALMARASRVVLAALAEAEAGAEAESGVRATAASRRGGGLTLVLADDATVRDLNRRFRGIDKPTNVLSFENGDRKPGRAGHSGLGDLGDVVLALETVASEARARDKPVVDHACHLIVHGVLHLLGHDHARVGDARQMEALEIRALSGLGIPNPYLPPRLAPTRSRRDGPGAAARRRRPGFGRR